MTNPLPLAGRNIYLENIPREEALARLLARIPAAALPAEEIPVPEALGRVAAEAVYAAVSSPHFHAAAMDGYAVRAEQTFGASPVQPITLRVDVDAHPVDTGDLLPPGCDAVAMIEIVDDAGDGTIRLEAALSPWHHVRVAGEDVVEGQLLFPAGHRLRPYDLGGMLAAGVTRVRVRKRPVVAIIPTGDELVPPGADLRPGDLIEFNSVILSSYISEWGGAPVVRDIVKDTFGHIEAALAEELERADIVLINAGSSAGREDFTAGVIRKRGEVLVHGVAIFPGKPTILGVCPAASGEAKPVLGIPGYPVSAALAVREFARPLMAHMMGAPVSGSPVVTARLSRKSASHPGMEEFLRVKLGEVGGKMMALPAKRGASVISSLIEADGIVRIPARSEGIEAGEEVQVELLRPLSEIKGNILVAGSHDNALDLLTAEIRRRHPAYSLSTSAVGSMAGLMALRAGEAHVAGSHLLDPESGDYNWSYIRRYLKGKEVVVVNFVQREQGIFLPPGNPKGIKGVEDLAREGVVIVNRQSGAGTRILLDHLLKEKGIVPGDVAGYERVETTHMAVAMAVAAGRADAGLGIRAAANLLGLDFLPLSLERFDFIFSAESWAQPSVQRMAEILRDPAFAHAIEGLGGYNTALTGHVLSPPDGA
ncbi:MAG: molybdopterin biosynthesis protein [bacterium]|nr:molybdopterin biosynthesis protein [bacterium]